MILTTSDKHKPVKEDRAAQEKAEEGEKSGESAAVGELSADPATCIE